MIHTMKLYEQPFQSIKSGKKTVEVRLNDEKRRKISCGDMIEFIKMPDKTETLRTKVLELKRYDSFQDMYETIPADDLDATGQSIDKMLKDTYQIYSSEQEERWGTLAITIRLLV
ncbi:ASC-1-like (ASCH) protein [Virgibacillus halotolerans]|uniref:ASCH domain-containing protein n=1 Tax=Virgibacillus halotolerans TaxID=1071053 RepID=UPI00196087C7|nr:ASCH domain-containing protein [Virgibacillus halotolerans]MBM7600368.1 ASC-1-like (ASCH) protein [Virgibacillus halotolerans]